MALLALGIFKELYDLVKSILDLPDLPQEQTLVLYPNNSLALNWWANLIYTLDMNAL